MPSLKDREQAQVEDESHDYNDRDVSPTLNPSSFRERLK
jgi:hypothetical protein